MRRPRARIGIDARCLTGSRTGVGNYVETLLGPLCEHHREVTFVLYSNGDGDLPSGSSLVQSNQPA